MLAPAATVLRLWLLQAKANVESARVKMKPPWQIWWPLRCKGCTVMRITARPGATSTSSMPMVDRLATSAAIMDSPTRAARCSGVMLIPP